MEGTTSSGKDFETAGSRVSLGNAVSAARPVSIPTKRWNPGVRAILGTSSTSLTTDALRSASGFKGLRFRNGGGSGDGKGPLVSKSSETVLEAKSTVPRRARRSAFVSEAARVEDALRRQVLDAKRAKILDAIAIAHEFRYLRQSEEEFAREGIELRQKVEETACSVDGGGIQQTARVQGYVRAFASRQRRFNDELEFLKKAAREAIDVLSSTGRVNDRTLVAMTTIAAIASADAAEKLAAAERETGRLESRKRDLEARIKIARDLGLKTAEHLAKREELDRISAELEENRRRLEASRAEAARRSEERYRAVMQEFEAVARKHPALAPVVRKLALNPQSLPEPDDVDARIARPARLLAKRLLAELARRKRESNALARLGNPSSPEDARDALAELDRLDREERRAQETTPHVAEKLRRKNAAEAAAGRSSLPEDDRSALKGPFAARPDFPAVTESSSTSQGGQDVTLRLELAAARARAEVLERELDQARASAQTREDELLKQLAEANARLAERDEEIARWRSAYEEERRKAEEAREKALANAGDATRSALEEMRSRMEASLADVERRVAEAREEGRREGILSGDLADVDERRARNAAIEEARLLLESRLKEALEKTTFAEEALSRAEARLSEEGRLRREAEARLEPLRRELQARDEELGAARRSLAELQTRFAREVDLRREVEAKAEANSRELDSMRARLAEEAARQAASIQTTTAEAETARLRAQITGLQAAELDRTAESRRQISLLEERLREAQKAVEDARLREAEAVARAELARESEQNALASARSELAAKSAELKAKSREAESLRTQFERSDAAQKERLEELEKLRRRIDEDRRARVEAEEALRSELRREKDASAEARAALQLALQKNAQAAARARATVTREKDAAVREASQAAETLALETEKFRRQAAQFKQAMEDAQREERAAVERLNALDEQMKSVKAAAEKSEREKRETQQNLSKLREEALKQISDLRQRGQRFEALANQQYELAQDLDKKLVKVKGDRDKLAEQKRTLDQQVKRQEEQNEKIRELIADAKRDVEEQLREREAKVAAAEQKVRDLEEAQRLQVQAFERQKREAVEKALSESDAESKRKIQELEAQLKQKAFQIQELVSARDVSNLDRKTADEKTRKELEDLRKQLEDQRQLAQTANLGKARAEQELQNNKTVAQGLHTQLDQLRQQLAQNNQAAQSAAVKVFEDKLKDSESTVAKLRQELTAARSAQKDDVARLAKELEDEKAQSNQAKAAADSLKAGLRDQAQLEKRIDELVEQLKAAQEAARKSEDRRKELEKALVERATEGASAKKTETELAQARRDLTKQKSDAAAAEKDLKDKIQKLQAQVERADKTSSELDKVRKELDDAKLRHRNVVDQLNAASQEAVKSLQGEIERLQKERPADLGKRLDEANQKLLELEALQKSDEAIRKELDEVKKRSSETTAAKSELEKKLATAEREKLAAEAESKKLREELVQRASDAEALRKTIKERDDLAAQVKALSESQTVEQKELASLRARLKRLEDDAKRAETNVAKLSELETEKARLETELGEAKRKIQSEAEELDAFKLANAEQTRKIEGLESETKELERKLQESEAQRTVAQESLAEVRKDVETANLAKADLEEEIRRVKEDLKTNRTSSEEAAKTQALLNQKTQELTDIETKKSKLKAKAKDLKAKLREAENQKASTEKTLQETQERQKSLEDKLIDLEKELPRKEISRVISWLRDVNKARETGFGDDLQNALVQPLQTLASGLPTDIDRELNEQLQNEINTLQSLLHKPVEELSQKLQQAETELQIAKESQAKVKDLEDEVIRLKKEVKMGKTREETLKNNAAGARSALSIAKKNFQKANQDLRNELKDLQERSASDEEQRMTLAKDYDQLKEASLEAFEANESLKEKVKELEQQLIDAQIANASQPPLDLGVEAMDVSNDQEIQSFKDLLNAISLHGVNASGIESNVRSQVLSYLAVPIAREVGRAKLEWETKELPDRLAKARDEEASKWRAGMQHLQGRETTPRLNREVLQEVRAVEQAKDRWKTVAARLALDPDRVLTGPDGEIQKILEPILQTERRNWLVAMNNRVMFDLRNDALGERGRLVDWFADSMINKTLNFAKDQLAPEIQQALFNKQLLDRVKEELQDARLDPDAVTDENLLPKFAEYRNWNYDQSMADNRNLERLQTEVERLETRVSDVAADRNETAETREAYRRYAQQFQDRIKQLEAANQQVYADNAALLAEKQALADSNAQLVTLVNQVSAIADVSKVKGETTLQPFSQRLLDKLSNTLNAASQANSTILRLQQENARLLQNLGQRVAAPPSQEAQSSKSAKSAAADLRELERLRTETTALAAQVLNLQNENAQLKTQDDQQLKTLRSENDALKQAQLQLAQSLEELQQQKQSLLNQANLGLHQNEDLRNRIAHQLSEKKALLTGLAGMWNIQLPTVIADDAETIDQFESWLLQQLQDERDKVGNDYLRVVGELQRANLLNAQAANNETVLKNQLRELQSKLLSSYKNGKDAKAFEEASQSLQEDLLKAEEANENWEKLARQLAFELNGQTVASKPSPEVLDSALQAVRSERAASAKVQKDLLTQIATTANEKEILLKQLVDLAKTAQRANLANGEWLGASKSLIQDRQALEAYFTNPNVSPTLQKWWVNFKRQSDVLLGRATSSETLESVSLRQVHEKVVDLLQKYASENLANEVKNVRAFPTWIN